MTPLLWATLAVSAGPLPIDVFFHGDLDGQLATPSCQGAAAGTPGKPELSNYAALVQALDDARSAQLDRPSLALLGPNAIAPDLFTRRLFVRDPGRAARDLADVFHRAGYAAFAVGSHDLAFEPAWLEAFLTAMTGAGIPAVAANVTCDEVARKRRSAACAALTAGPLVVPVTGVGKVAIVQAISPRLWSRLAVDRRDGLSVTDPRAHLQTASREARRSGASLVVALIEVPTGRDGLDELKEWQSALDRGDRPDLLLASGLADDDGRKTIRLLRQDGAPAAAGSTTGPRGLVRVTTAATAPADWRGPPEVSVQSLPAAAAATGDLATRLAEWHADYCASFGTPLGRTLDGSLGYDDFVTYVLEVMRRAAGAEVALLNRRFVKTAGFPWRGAITEGDLAQALPYAAVLGVARITGAQVQSLIGPARAQPRLATVGINREGPLRVNGREVDATRFYRVATIAFVAQGGDGLFEAGALPWKPVGDSPDLRKLVRDFLLANAARDKAATLADDFGASPEQRALIVALTDLDLGLSSTRVDNGASYTDAQLTRAQQRAFKGDWNTVVTLRGPSEDMDARFRLQYGWTRTEPAGQPAVSGESLDLVAGTVTYTDRRLRRLWSLSLIAPDPYARLFLESELTRPAVSPSQARSYHHAEMTATVGASIRPATKLRIRVGPGARRELLAPGAAGEWRFALEAGATLEPTAIATVGPLPVRLEGNLDYFLVQPTGGRSQQLRGSARLSFPLLPTLFLAVGVDVYGAQYGGGPWQSAVDGSASLRVHWDRAHQWM